MKQVASFTAESDQDMKVGVKMLKQKVVVKGPDELFGQVGIIVAVKSFANEKSGDREEGIACKVLVGEIISNWMPYHWLEVLPAA
ncbi:MAG: hypothetical protein ABFD08_02890 [Syntrophomonas sp.]